MTRITPKPIPPGGLLKTPKTRFTAGERRYYRWVHSLCSCIVTGQDSFDIAHTGDLRHGKGMGVKSNLDTCLPLIRPLHIHEESGRAIFWRTVGLPDYIDLARGLHEIFKAGLDPEPFLQNCQSRIDREYVCGLLGEIDY